MSDKLIAHERDELFRSLVRRAGEELVRSPGHGGHVHFDDALFADVVPSFSDRDWIRLARVAIAELADFAYPMLVHVPVGQVARLPDDGVLDNVDVLDPWMPPAIHVLTEGSAFEARTAHWHVDLHDRIEGAVGWLSAYRDDDLEEPLWKLSVMYETTRIRADALPSAGSQTKKQFIDYVGPPQIHDARIVTVDVAGSDVTVEVVDPDRNRFHIRLADVAHVESHEPTGMILFSISRLEADPPDIRYEFVNWDEDDDRFLSIVARSISWTQVHEEPMG